MSKNHNVTREASTHRSLIMNWISLLGILMAAFGFVVGISLIVMDALNPFPNPYLGIFVYMVVPAILSTGLLLVLAGVLRERQRRRRQRPGTLRRMPVIDFNVKRQLYGFVTVAMVTLMFVILSGVGSYRAYHFTETVTFCGATCHSVMEPEYTAYRNSPHANVHCTKCHIGPGADWFVKAKVNGLYQVYSTLFDKYNRPIPTPVANLRPAQETCYMCHWPEKFFGALEWTRTYYATDKENTPWTLRMLIKVGGGNLEHGPVRGIHWHMVSNSEIEYVAADEERQIIPWIRQTDMEGNVTVYRTTDPAIEFSEDMVTPERIRTMDCIDCHNRPSHNFHPPNFALDMALETAEINPALPWVKKVAAEALLAEYESQEQAFEGIEATMREEFGEGDERVDRAIRKVQQIYGNNFFPEMKVDWSVYPDHIGHFIAPGCFRCHDGNHVSESGAVIRNDCNICHTIISQGDSPDGATISTAGLEFEHPPGNDLMEDMLCSDCHTGEPDL